MKKLIILAIYIVNIYASSLIEENKRYFGGYSQNKVILIKSTIHTAPLVVTEEVFNAKSPDDIDRAVEKQQLADIAKGITAKEFLEDRAGHLYGGFSENKINLLNQ